MAKSLVVLDSFKILSYARALKLSSVTAILRNSPSSLPLLYALELEINLLDFNPSYPKNPQALGERIRKIRINKEPMIKELAFQLGVTEDTAINSLKLIGKMIERLEVFV